MLSRKKGRRDDEDNNLRETGISAASGLEAPNPIEKDRKAHDGGDGPLSLTHHRQTKKRGKLMTDHRSCG